MGMSQWSFLALFEAVSTRSDMTPDYVWSGFRGTARVASGAQDDCGGQLRRFRRNEEMKAMEVLPILKEKVAFLSDCTSRSQTRIVTEKLEIFFGTSIEWAAGELCSVLRPPM
ncbi:triple functional domain protein isoform X1 [Tachysurus ichikawai]